MKMLMYENQESLDSVIARSHISLTQASSISSEILEDVSLNGDEALFRYTQKFDNFMLSKENIRVSKEEVKKAVAHVDKKILEALVHASRNIEKYHRKQLSNVKKQWHITVQPGVTVGERTTPIDSAGCYVPGGRAAYTSTVLMTAIPAKVAGVKRVAVASPPPIPDVILAACDICGVDEVYRIGGAQAVGALAYGTASIPRVSKIVGPGNKYVMTAKNLVYGIVDVDMPAGPSEVLIIADETANPDWIAADLMAQAEHDPDAHCVLITTSKKLLKAASRQAPEKSVGILAKTIKDCVEFANAYAPEHLEVVTKNPRNLAGRINNAGAVFLGPYSPVAAGDYASGANHVLPTGGAARFSSPLSVRDFLKTTSVQEISKKGIAGIGTTIQTLAQAEGLIKHQQSIDERLR
jgi:histidinol dehydrogenase